jgi:predicted neutral ceramidase superfamily lipid hydrolase
MSAAPGDHTGHVHGTTTIVSGLTATALHSASYLLVTAAVAWVVFHKLGVGLLRKAWINLDLVWAVALIASGGLTILLT